jgi:hypothetical protein
MKDFTARNSEWYLLTVRVSDTVIMVSLNIWMYNLFGSSRLFYLLANHKPMFLAGHSLEVRWSAKLAADNQDFSGSLSFPDP